MTKKLIQPCKRLDSQRSVRREAAYLYRICRDGEFDISDGSKLCNMLQIIGKLLQQSDLEERIEALESQLSGKPYERKDANSETRATH